MNVRLYVWQRLTAAVIVPLALVHIGVIFYATRHGLSAAEIFGRTRGSIAWGMFYALFVAAVSIHVPIGLRTVLIEWTALDRHYCDGTAIAFGILLALAGLRAAAAVVLP
jgi:succinate dehydrogenase subunit C